MTMTTNCKITHRGVALNNEIAKFVGITQQTLEICSLIARHARTHARLMEAQCNRELTGAEILQERHIEDRIRRLVADFPQTAMGAIKVRFEGDPRGYTVKLIVPGDSGGNTWGRGGEYGI